MNAHHRAGRAAAAIAALALAGTLAGCGGEPSLYDLKVGDCLNSSDITSEKVLTVTPLGCSTSHDLEIYAAGAMEEEEFPGRDTASSFAESFCFSEFEGFVGLPYEQSALSFSWLYPTAETWDARGDREVLCLLQSPEPVTSSLEGSAR
nr:hypothetical protein [Actinomycetales bacterium]